MKTPLKIGFIMDPLSTVKREKDTSYFLMLAAKKRGHQVYYIDQDDLQVSGQSLFSRTTELDVLEAGDFPFEEVSKSKMDLGEMDALWVRKDPPFDRRYFYTTLCLDVITDRVAVINAPESLRSWNEKLAAMWFPSLTPETLFSAQVEDVVSFTKKNQKAVIKPVDGHGGRGIHFLDSADPNLNKTVQEIVGRQKEKWIVQEMVAGAEKGDKRILLLDGEPLGAVLRVGESGGLNNLDQGGQAVATELTARDLEICKALKEPLKQNGLFFVGIDVLGDKLTEINVTSPTGLQEASRFSGRDLHLEVMEALERRVG